MAGLVDCVLGRGHRAEAEAGRQPGGHGGVLCEVMCMTSEAGQLSRWGWGLR